MLPANLPKNPHGWVNLYKPEGVTSAQAVAKVKRALNVKKLGHTGTLDPLACGVLPLAIGEATKLSDYVMAEQKTYRFTAKWGVQTTTDDREGEAIHHSDNRPSHEAVQAVLPQFTGEILQRPPDFSAIKVKGKRSYKAAREGEKIDLPKRPVTVFSMQVESHQTDSTTFRVTCGKGTYIRSLVRDMGEVLGCYGTVIFLERAKTGYFTADNAISLDVFTDMKYTDDPDFTIMPMDVPLDDIPAVHVMQSQALRLRQGKWANPLEAAIDYRRHAVMRCYDENGRFFALVSPIGSFVKSVRVFNL